MCPSALSVYVPQITTCLCALNNYMPMFPSFSHAYLAKCVHANTYFLCFASSCIKLFHALQNVLRLTFISCIATFHRTIWPLIPVKTPKQTPASKSYIPKSYLIGLPCWCIHKNNNLTLFRLLIWFLLTNIDLQHLMY